MKTLTFYFALRSPYSALASDLVYEAAQSGAFKDRVDFRVSPFSSANPNFQDPTSNPLKVNYILKDLPRLYRSRGLALQLPDPFEVDFSVPARMALAAEEDGRGVEYVRAVSLLRWSEGRDVSARDTLMEAAERAGWSRASAERAQADLNLQSAYEQAVAAADAAGVFGVPFFIVSDAEGSEPFWGQDRWPMVEAALAR